jgi:uncharacterized protein with HEPN domain
VIGSGTGCCNRLKFNRSRLEDEDRLYHILESSREAVGYAQGRTRKDLETDRPFTHSLVRCLEVVGEAASKISKEFRQAHPQIAWDDMISMRHKLIHAYFKINLNIVWRTVQEELPTLIAELEKILEKDSTE